jgi:hypothetical protein
LGVAGFIFRSAQYVDPVPAFKATGREYAARELAYKAFLYSRKPARLHDAVAAALRAFDLFPELLDDPESAAIGIALAVSASPFDVVRGHSDVVSHVEFSPDGSRILSAS